MAAGWSYQDVGVVRALQAFPADVLKLLYQLALVSCIVNQHIDAAPLAHSLFHNLPAAAPRHCLLLLGVEPQVTAAWRQQLSDVVSAYTEL